jgi:hypothetical protein
MWEHNTVDSQIFWCSKVSYSKLFIVIPNFIAGLKVSSLPTFAFEVCEKEILCGA